VKTGVKIIVAMALLAVLLACAGTASLLWVTGTERGAAWAFALAEERSQGRFSVAEVRGTLLSGVTVTALEVRLPEDVIQAEEVTLVWDARTLLRGALVIDALESGPVLYRRLASDAGESTDGELELPVPIVLLDAVAERITVELPSGVVAELGETRLAGAASGTEVSLDRVETSWSGFVLNGRSRIDFAAGIRLDAELDWSGAFEGQALEGSGVLQGRFPVLSVSHRLTQPFEVLTDGVITLGAAPEVELSLAWTELAWPGIDLVASRSGSASLSGRLDAYRFEGAGVLRVDGEDVELAASGTGEGLRILIEEIALENPYGAVTGAGNVDVGALTWDLSLEARDVDPTLRFSDWPGGVSARGRLSGRAEPRLEWRVSELEVEGELRGFPFAAHGGVAHEGEQWHFDALRVESGPNLVLVSGTAGEMLELTLSADVERLDALWPELEGSALAEVVVGGTQSEPRASGWLRASALRFGEYAVGSLSVVSDVSRGNVEALDIAIDAAELSRGNVEVEALRARLAGALDNHEISIEAEADQWRGRLGARGGVADRIWHGRLDSLTLDQAALGEWRLVRSTALALGADAVSVDATCLVQSQAELCGSLQWLGQAGDRLELTARDFDLRALQPFLPEGFGAEGVYQASVSLTDLGRWPRGAVIVDGGPTILRLALPGQAGFETRIRDVRLDAALAERQLTVEASLDGEDMGTVSFTARVDDIEDERSPVEGALRIFWSDLGVLALLSPDVREVDGTLGVDLMLGGTLAEPAVEGRAALDDGEIRVPDLGLHIENIRARGTSADGRVLRFTATGLVDESELQLEGETQLDYRASWPTRLTLYGESIPAVRLPEAEIFVSPNLEADIRLPDITVSGTVHVPRAAVTLQELPVQAVAPSSDAVVHGVAQPEAARPLHMRADLRLTLGENVRYTGMNLSTAVTGEMRLAYTSGRPASATGTVSVDGNYNAYGQPLALERGELIFAGPLDDPALDVRAVREVNDVTVGVQLTGTLKSPETRIFSTPTMSETDALSYLVFGRPLAGSGGDDSQALQSAAIAMGLQQALPVVQRIGETLGFDEFAVRTTDDDAGALMAGKYLTPDLYVRYSYGLFNRIGGLLLRFRVNERLSLETRSGDEKSMDLLYTVEKP
jgi:translocation and assembly module TamB